SGAACSSGTTTKRGSPNREGLATWARAPGPAASPERSWTSTVGSASRARPRRRCTVRSAIRLSVPWTSTIGARATLCHSTSLTGAPHCRGDWLILSGRADAPRRRRVVCREHHGAVHVAAQHAGAGLAQQGQRVLGGVAELVVAPGGDQCEIGLELPVQRGVLEAGAVMGDLDDVRRARIERGELLLGGGLQVPQGDQAGAVLPEGLDHDRAVVGGIALPCAVLGGAGAVGVLRRARPQHAQGEPGALPGPAGGGDGGGRSGNRLPCG